MSGRDPDRFRSEVTAIAVAVVRHRQHVLVGVRSPDTVLPGMAEFPGGKLQRDESAAAAAVRECLEETGIHVAVERLLAEVTHEYPHGRLRLAFFDCRLIESDAELPAPHLPFRWLPQAELATLSFPAANQRVLRWLEEND